MCWAIQCKEKQGKQFKKTENINERQKKRQPAQSFSWIIAYFSSSLKYGP